MEAGKDAAANQTATTSPRRGRLIPRWLKTTLLVVVTVPIVTWLALDLMAARRLTRAREAFAAHGFPSSLDEILPAPVADADNAAPLIEAAWLSLGGEDNGAQTEDPSLFTVLDDLIPALTVSHDGLWRCPPGRRDQLVEFARDPEVIRVCREVRDAARRKSFVPPVDYSLGFDVEIPHIRHIRELVRLLCVCAFAQAVDTSSFDPAGDNLLAAIQLSSWACSGSGMIEGLTGVMCLEVCRNTLLGAIEVGGTPSDFPLWQATWSNVISTHSRWFARACHGERLMLVGWLDRKFAAGSNDWVRWFLTMAKDDNHRKVPSTWMTRCMSFVARPYAAHSIAEFYERHLTVAKAASDSSLAGLRELRTFTERSRGDDSLLVRLFMPTLLRVAMVDRVHRSKLQAIVLFLHALEHRRRFGDWPTSVEQLGMPPEKTLDPCSEKLFVLQRSPEGILVYAFGLDGDDDGGATATPGAETGPEADGDIVVRLHFSAAMQ